MEINDLRQLNEKELKDKLQEKRNELLKLRIKKASSQLKNVREIRLQRKEVARILTILREKQLESKKR